MPSEPPRRGFGVACRVSGSCEFPDHIPHSLYSTPSQTLADISDPASSAFRKSLHELGRICGTQEILPKSCTLSGSLLDTGLLFASGYASEGKLDGSKVCVKRVWTYTNEDPQEVKKVCYLLHHVSPLPGADQTHSLSTKRPQCGNA